MSLFADVVCLKRQLDIVLVDCADQHSDGLGLVRADTEQHLVEDHAQRPDIGLRCVIFPLQYLRSHIDGGSQHGLGHVFSRLQSFAKSEVSQLYSSIIKENILRLYVAMHNIEPIQNLECLKQLAEDCQSFFL